VVKSEELFNFYSHLIGMVVAIIATIFLLYTASGSTSMVAVAAVYGFSVIFLLLASSLYHFFKTEDNELSFWRKMDRLAIFFMIAGSYTPVCYFFLDDDWRLPMIAVQWGLVAFGMLSQIFFPRAPRMIYAAMFLMMGWLVVLPISQILENMSENQVSLLFSGGVAFSLGALFYAIKKPLLFPGIFSFHELFHVMVLIGAGCHYALIYSAFSAAASVQ
jgi:hemolysin III